MAWSRANRLTPHQSCRINDRIVSLISLIGLLAYHLITFPWQFFTAHVHVFNDTGQPAVPTHLITE